MNKLATLSMLAAAALTVAPKPAQAGDKEAAIIGGMIIGGVIGAVIANNTDNCGPTAVYCPPPAPVVYAPAPVYCEPAGYWNEVRVQVYVPGCWSFRYDCGRQVRYYSPGHYEYRTNRVWVANNNRYDNHRYGQDRNGHYGQDHNGREVSRNNDRRGNDDRRRNH